MLQPTETCLAQDRCTGCCNKSKVSPAELSIQLHLWCFQVDLAHSVAPVVARQLRQINITTWHLQQQQQQQEDMYQHGGKVHSCG